MRVVSLVPSITEALFDLGLTPQEIVGRTKFCIHPSDKIIETISIGGTKNPHIDKIIALQPDLIIANKEENRKEDIQRLQQHCKVWVTEIETVEDNIKLLHDLGYIFNKKEQAVRLIQQLNTTFEQLPTIERKKCLYLIWQEPYMSIGRDTFIHDVLTRIGFVNIKENHTRYPEVSTAQFEDADCIFLSSEPFPFKEKHVEALQQEYPTKLIRTVDGEAFSWYGTRLLHCGNYFKELLIDVQKKL